MISISTRRWKVSTKNEWLLNILVLPHPYFFAYSRLKFLAWRESTPASWAGNIMERKPETGENKKKDGQPQPQLQVFFQWWNILLFSCPAYHIWIPGDWERKETKHVCNTRAVAFPFFQCHVLSEMNQNVSFISEIDCSSSLWSHKLVGRLQGAKQTTPQRFLML